MNSSVTIKNREDLLSSGPHGGKKLALDLFETGLTAARPARAIKDRIELRDNELKSGNGKYDLGEVERLIVLGGGKATLEMAKSLEEILGDRISTGLIVVKSRGSGDDLKRIAVREGQHPVPDKSGMEATGKLVDLAKSAGEKDLVITLISGGGSSLLTYPGDGFSLEEVKQLTKGLLESGASIDEINKVRKTISAIKGGRLARAIHPAKTLSLIVSDVVGDDLRYIASGPTVPDDVGPEEAWQVLKKYGLADSLSEKLCQMLKQPGAKATEPPVGEKEFEGFDVRNEIIASNTTALSAIAARAKRKGVEPLILSSRLEGESRYQGTWFGQLAASIHAENRPLARPAALIAGGETTVSVSGNPGAGGPNQEFSLAAGLEIQGVPEAVIGAIDSDGEDGSTSCAGGLLDGNSINDPEEIKNYLRQNRSSRALKELGSDLITGVTGTNVNDIRLAVLRKTELGS